jgi:hypothetical protein
MIPPIIHYCWFGKQPKSKLIQKCIASWQQFMPNWEVREWNEDNYNIDQNEYMQEAYHNGKWAFVVDSARFDILNRHGGIFLDADVELLRPIPKEILAHSGFTGFEGDTTVAPGLIFASLPQQPILTAIVEVYNHKEFGKTKNNGRLETIVDIVTDILVQNGMKQNNTYQVVAGMAIYPKDFFCAFNPEIQNFELTSNTVSIHHYAASWSPWYRRLRFRTIKWIATILGKKNYLGLKRVIKGTTRTP